MSDIFNSADFIEQLIRGFYRSPSLIQYAVELGVTPNDFGTLRVYNLFVDVAISLRTVVSPETALIHLKAKMPDYELGDANSPQVASLWSHVFSTAVPDTEFEYLKRTLPAFVKFRRYQEIQGEHHETPEELVQAATALLSDLELRTKSGDVRESTPFLELTMLESRPAIFTGFDAIDQCTHGLQIQEFGMILGHSGSGKTAMAVYSALQTALDGHKVLYLSAEEPMENINYRVYSNIFRIEYSNLHVGDALAKDELRRAFNLLDPVTREKLSNLKVHDMRDVTPMTAAYILDYLNDYYRRTGWAPTVVYIDQLDYMTSSEKVEATWQKIEKTTFEIDWLSNQLIGGEHKFSVWLLHQVGGKMQRKFTNAEISGFKGVLKPVDMALAIGRDTPQDTLVSIFSLKARHAKNFQFDYHADLKFMNFEEAGHADVEKMNQENKDKRDKKKDPKMPPKSDFNIQRRPSLDQLPVPCGPPPSSLLPPPSGSFQ